MSEAMKLVAQLRTGKVSDLKEAIPAVVYGQGMDNVNLVVKRPGFEKVFHLSGESGLVSLDIDGKQIPVIIKDVQVDALKNRIIHIDFYKVDMTQTVVAEVTLNFIGEAPAVKNFNAIIVDHLDHIEIECLPADLMQKIDIDISKLANIGDAIHVKDLVLPKGIEVKNVLDEIIVNAVEPKKVVEEVPVVAEAEAAATTEAGAEEAKTEGKTEEKKEEKK